MDGGLALFAISTWAPWATPSSTYDAGLAGDVDFSIYLDTNSDGTPDFVVRVQRAIAGTDILSANLYDLSQLPANPTDDDLGAADPVDSELLNGVDGTVDTDLLQSDSMAVPVAIGALGLPAGTTTIGYEVVTRTLDGDPITLDDSGEQTFDLAHPAVSVLSAAATGATVLFRDKPGTSLPVTRDASTVGSMEGLLLIHHHNVDGARAQVVGITTTAPAASPSPSPSAAPVVSTSTTKVSGPTSVRHAKGYLYRVAVIATDGKTPVLARTVGLYVDGVRRATLRTGAKGTASYYVSFRKGSHSVTAKFFGAPDLLTSRSGALKVRAT
jgi:hypothetical protein